MRKLKKQKGYTLIELLLVLGIVAVIAIVMFIAYASVSEKLIIKKQEDRMDLIVTTTNSIYSKLTPKEIMLSDQNGGITDVVIRDIVIDQGLSYPKDEDLIKLTPFLETVSIVPVIGDEGYKNNGHQFYYQAQYPRKGGITESRCINIAKIYLAKHGNVVFSADPSDGVILNDDSDKNTQIVDKCSMYKDKSSTPSAGIGFFF